jgi:hypothetical protein
MYRVLLATVTSLLLAVGVAASSSPSFFEAADGLRRELDLWRLVQIANLSDIIGRLDGIVGRAFLDVPDDAWYRSYVSFLSQAGIVTGEKDAAGVPTGYFRPERTVTVAEVLKMAMGAAKLATTSCPSAPTHAEAVGHWAAAYVACAEAGDVRLVDTRVLNLDRPATRAEMVGVVMDVFGDKPIDVFPMFFDTKNHPMERDIAYLAYMGVVSGDMNNGKATGTFRPDANLNRAEAAKIIYERIRLDARREWSEG